MTAARMGYRTNQRETIDNLTQELEYLRKENTTLKSKLKGLEGE